VIIIKAHTRTTLKMAENLRWRHESKYATDRHILKTVTVNKQINKSEETTCQPVEASKKLFVIIYGGY
jgi:hypothetical protein